MHFTFSSLITTLFFSTIFVIFLSFLLKSNIIIKKTGVRVLFVSIIISMVQLLIPFEFPFTKTIAISKIWPSVYLFFYKNIFALNNRPVNMVNLLFIIWAAGIIFFIIKKTFSYYNLIKLIKIQREADANLKSIVDAIVKGYHKNNKFLIVVSPGVGAPMVLGLLKPAIILPDITLTNKEWYYILSHEIAHYYNGDLLVKFIIEFFTAIYWWNPFVYYLKKQTASLLEINTDATLVRQWDDGEKLEYASCLLKLSRSQTDYLANNWLAALLNNDITAVPQRVKLIYDKVVKNEKQSRKTTFTILCVSLIIILLPVFLIIEPYSILPEDEEGTFSVVSDNLYYIKNDGGTYDFYLNDEFIMTHEKIMDSRIIIYEQYAPAGRHSTR